MGTNDKPLPLTFQSVQGVEEYAVFNRMMLVLNKGAIDLDKMALDWCNHVDGVTCVSKVTPV
jgi:hypothetical protein